MAVTPLNAVGINDFDQRVKNAVPGFVQKTWVDGRPAIFDVVAYGAAGDNVANDTTAITNAISAASSNGGGVVFFPPGTYKCTAQITVPSYVHLEGCGMGKSVLSWATDIGTTIQALAHNVAAIDASGAGNQSAAPTFRGLQLLGPNTTFAPNSARAVKMDGIRLGGNQAMYDCFVQGFGGGVVAGNDHLLFVNLKSSNNYYNVLYPSPRDSQGNHTYIHCVLDGASFACIAVGGDVLIDNSIFIGGHVGGAPYGLYKGDQYNLASTEGFINQTAFHDFSFEGIGNNAIKDASTGTGSGQDSITNCTIDNPGFVWDGSKAITLQDHNYCVDVRNVSDLILRQGSNGFTVFPSTGLAALRATVGMNGTVEFGGQGGQATNFFGPGTVGVWVKYPSQGWEGRVWSYTGTVTAGDLLMFDTANASTVLRNSGTASSASAMPAGVAGLAPVSGSNLVAVAERGIITFATTAGTGAGRLVVPDATNYQGTTGAPTGKKVFGVCTVGGGSPSMRLIDGGWNSP